MDDMANEEPIRVLVVDDTAIYRKIVSDVLEAMPGVEVVGRAGNGQIALTQIVSAQPHLVTLDVEMPVMDGLETLRQIQQRNLQVGVIMLSALTTQHAAATVQALELGALDFVLKPTSGNWTDNTNKLRDLLSSRVVSLGKAEQSRRIARRVAAPTAGSAATVRTAPMAAPVAPVLAPIRAIAAPQVVVVGISTGGPAALQRFLPAIPADLAVPLLIVQHMPPVFTKSLADDLNRRCPLTVCEATHGQLLQPGFAYIAPGGRQMKMVRVNGVLQVAITDDPHENSCRPSVDYLFRSATQVCGGRIVAAIMTGMGNDGAAGCRLVRQQGGTVFAQDEASCVVYGMPRQPVEEGLASVIGPPERLAAEVIQLARRRELACR
jgi:two-component system chemotaxis response regulator CheB